MARTATLCCQSGQQQDSPSENELADVRKHVPWLLEAETPGSGDDSDERLLGDVAVIVEKDKEDEKPRLVVSERCSLKDIPKC